MDSIGTRLLALIIRLDENQNSFSKKIGLTNNVTIGRIIKENRKPSGEVLAKIVQTYGSVNTNWLLVGKGPMFIDHLEHEGVNKEIKTNSIEERVAALIERLDYTSTSFANTVGLPLSPDILDSILTKKSYRRLELDQLLGILERFSAVNGHWLLTGKGSMFLKYQLEPFERPLDKIYQNSIRGRFNQLLAEIRHFEPFDNDTQLAERIGTDYRTLVYYKEGRLNFTIEFLSKILSTFDYLDGGTLDWLMTGKGHIINDRPVRIKLDIERNEI